MTPDQEALPEILLMLEQLQQLFCDFTVGGLFTAGNHQISTLKALQQELAHIGALHLAEQLQQLLWAIEHQQHEAAVLLMRTQASVRLFDRLLTLKQATAWMQPDDDLANR